MCDSRGALADVVILARPKGLEPLTGGLETRCSIRLSYERVLRNYDIRLILGPVSFRSGRGLSSRVAEEQRGDQRAPSGRRSGAFRFRKAVKCHLFPRQADPGASIRGR